jgi:hypothetical protein
VSLLRPDDAEAARFAALERQIHFGHETSTPTVSASGSH